MASFVTPNLTVAFATDGTASGTFTLASVTGLYVDSIVNITATAKPHLRCKIININTATMTVKVQVVTEFLLPNGGAVYPFIPDLSTYTTAASASVYQPAQTVYVVGLQSFVT